MLDYITEGGKVIVNLEAEFTIREVKGIKTMLSKWEKEKQSKITLDMSEVKFIDSSAIGILVMILKYTKRTGGYLKLYSIRPEIERILKMVNLYSYFEIVDKL